MEKTKRDEVRLKMKDSYCSYCSNALQGRYPKKCASCHEITFSNPLPVAVTLVPVGAGLMVVRRNSEPRNGFLCLPGGYMETGESWQQACCRELLEETSLEVDPKNIELFDVKTGANGNILIFGIALAPKIESVSGLTHDSEVSEITIRYESDSEELAFNTHAEVIKKFFKEWH